MSVIVGIVFGLVAAFFASKIANKSREGVLLDTSIVLFSLLGLLGCGSSTSSPSVSAISISPSLCAVGRTDSRQLGAEATLPDGTKEDITSNPGTQWSSANTNTATVDATGNVVGVNLGATRISANFEGASGSVTCTVGP